MTTKWRGSSRWPGKILNSPPPTDTTDLQLHMAQFPLKKTWKLAGSSSTKKDLKVPSRWVGEVVTGSHQKPHLQCSHPQSGGTSSIQSYSLRTERSVPSITNPNPRKLHQRDELPKHLALKTNGVYIQEDHRAVGNRLHSQRAWLTHPRTHHENSLKSTQTICEGGSFVNLKASEGGAGAFRTPWTEPWQLPFLHSPSVSLALALAASIFALLLWPTNTSGHTTPPQCSHGNPVKTMHPYSEPRFYRQKIKCIGSEKKPIISK